MLWGFIFDDKTPNTAASRGVKSRLRSQTPADDIAERRRAEIATDRGDIERFLTGDPDGFEALMKRYQRQAYGIALALCGNHDDAMDAMQKAFIRIHRSLGRFRLEDPFFPWLYRIVRNAALNQRRDEHRHKGDVPLEWVKQPDGRPTPLDDTALEELRVRLWQGIQELSPDLREVFVLYHFQGLKYREIAAAMDVPIGTVMSRLHSARTQLRKVLDDKETS